MSGSGAAPHARLHSRPVGRLLRFLLGAWLLVMIWPFLSRAAPDRVLGAVLVATGLAVLYTSLHWVVSSYLLRLNRWLGAFLAVLPVLAVFVLGAGLGEVGALLFLGISLLLAAIRADAGCEVMSIPAVVFGRHTHLVCLLFSPLDWIEEKIISARAPAGS